MTPEQKFNRVIFGMRIENARKSRRMRQQDLADAVGLDRSQIANIEGGGSSTTIDRLLALAKALKVRPATLLKGMD